MKFQKFRESLRHLNAAVLRRLCRRFVGSPEPAAVTKPEQLVLMFADQLAACRSVTEDRQEILIDEFGDYIRQVGVDLSICVGEFPVSRIYIANRLWAFRTGSTKTISLVDGAAFSKIASPPFETISYDLTALWICLPEDQDGAADTTQGARPR